MRIGIAAFTERGGQLGRFLLEEYGRAGYEAEGFLSERHRMENMQPFSDLGSATRLMFEREDMIVFVGACGIAVRAIAPYIKDKLHDPGVVVVDECGRHVISLLSGHVGRANDFTEYTARILDGEPVITTATDSRGLFAADQWAVRNRLHIVNPQTVKEISSRILAGERVGFFSEFPFAGELPAELTMENGEIEKEEVETGIAVSCENTYHHRFPVTLALMPKDLTVGIGCKSGKTVSELHDFLCQIFERYHLRTERIGKICSVSVKAREEGLIRLAQALGVPFETYTPGQLSQLEGDFAASEFVRAKIGVDNVCERSACFGSGGRKLVGRQTGSGMTIAVYERQTILFF